MQLTLTLQNLAATAAFGAELAAAVLRANPGVIFFYGGLGAGKTTLTRALVLALPGGNEAEVASPSFTICNIYCTAPVVHHFDLYRLGDLHPGGFSDEALEESLDDTSVLTLVEWAEHLSPSFFSDGLSVRFASKAPDGPRVLTLSALGPLGGQCLSAMASVYHVT